MNPESAVTERYSNAARQNEAALCCPTAYDPKLLQAIPKEVVEKDYGCGNPVAHVKRGETVLDLGSGSGKACFMVSQVVGPEGKVIGVDMNDEMLALARKNVAHVAERIGYTNVEFRKGKIQDLSLDFEHPGRPLVESGSVDVVISNCVLNLVGAEDKMRLFAEIFRVLKKGGRAVISDIVSDEDVPEPFRNDPELWSGCVSGAFREDLFLHSFEEAGFYGIQVLERQGEPWRTIEGIEFRSVTIRAYKGKEGTCLDQKHAVIYKGPFRELTDDDGHRYRRGERTAVCEKTYKILSSEPYRSHFDLVPPRVLIPIGEAPPFPCTKGALRRDPRDTKGAGYNVTTQAEPKSCAPGNGSNGGCCG